MGYELRIVRKTNWDSDKQSDISLNEWMSYVDTDKELKLTNGFQMNIPNVEICWKERPGLCEWLFHPDASQGFLPWFDYSNGSIRTKNPDNFTIKKLIEIAQTLKATVQGDDGEFYDESYFEKNESIERINTPMMKIKKKPWWKFWQLACQTWTVLL